MIFHANWMYINRSNEQIIVNSLHIRAKISNLQLHKYPFPISIFPLKTFPQLSNGLYLLLLKSLRDFSFKSISTIHQQLQSAGILLPLG
jgi:hypothetical protein